MDILEQMRSSLSPLGLYSLGNGTLVDGELRAYFTGQSFSQNRFNELLKSLWVETADEKIISLWCQRLGIFSGDTTEERKAEVMSCLRKNMQCSFLRDDIEDYIWKLGKPCAVYNAPQKRMVRLTFYFDANSIEDYAGPIGLARKCVPAHLSLTIGYPQENWNTKDASNRTFDRWDAMNFHWDIHEE